MRILIILLLLCVQVTAQELSLKKGVVTDSISVTDSLEESFALYLPQNFETDIALPVIFIFDGEGRGKSAAHLFQFAAEQQNYILVSSNNINPNRTLEENVTSAVRLIQDVSRRVPIDFNSLSVAGFAEGARVATSIPLLFENLHGVIYIGDQQINFDLLEKQEPFFISGIVGNRQLEAVNMELMSYQLKGIGFKNQIYTFRGGKEWPEAQLISSAVADLTLQAMREGKRPRNQQLIEELFQQDLGIVNKHLSTGNSLLANDLLDIFQDKYDGLREVSPLKEKQRQVRRSQNYREQQREFEEVANKESRLMEDFAYYMEEDIATLNFENLGWWNYQKLQLEELTNSESDPEAAMGYRLLDLLREMSKIQGNRLEETEADLEPKLLANMLATIFDPQYFEAYKKVISLSTIDGDFNTALFYLEEMLKNGYSDVDSLYEIEGTLGIRLSEDYNWLIKNYLGTSRYYDSSETF